MGELLAAIPRMFSMQRRDDGYARLRRAAHYDQIAQRAMSRTMGQMNAAYVKVVQEKADDSGTTAKHS